MAQPFKFRHQNEIVGAFVLVSVLTLLAAFVVLVRGQQWFQEYIEITAVFDARRVGLLREGVPVRVRSSTIGRVKEAHRARGNSTEVTLLINTDRVSDVNEDSSGVLYVPFAGLPGEPFIEIKPGASRESIRPGGRIRARVAPDVMQLAVDVLDDVHRDLPPALVEVTKLTRTMNRLIEAVEKSGEVPRGLARIADLEEGVGRLLGKVEGLVDRTTGTLTSVGKLVAKADHGDGLLARALNDRQLYGRLLVALAGMQTSMRTVQSLLAHADRAGKVLPRMSRLGVQALQDMVVVSKELRRLAPMMPAMAGQVDEVLFEGRAILQAAQRHWLLGGTLRPDANQPLMVPSGVRDAARRRPIAGLRRELGGDAATPGNANPGNAGPDHAASAGSKRSTKPGGPGGAR